MDYERIKGWQLADVEHTFGARDTMLHALAIGYGHDPLDVHQLRYVYEDGLVTAPSMAAILGYPGFWMNDPDTGIDAVKVVHVEQAMTLHAPLPVAGTVVGRTRVSAIVDKGAEKGALVYQERTVTDRDTGRLLATLELVNFCRGDGGLERSDPPRPAPHAPPDRAPDETCDLPTMPQAALLYRLASGDSNPLHADPQVSARAGFDRPILHGLCTFGVAVHALLRMAAGYEPDGIGRVSARFSAPVFPGETVRTELWREDGRVAFRARALERDTVVLSHGQAEVVA